MQCDYTDAISTRWRYTMSIMLTLHKTMRLKIYSDRFWYFTDKRKSENKHRKWLSSTSKTFHVHISSLEEANCSPVQCKISQLKVFFEEHQLFLTLSGQVPSIKDIWGNWEESLYFSWWRMRSQVSLGKIREGRLDSTILPLCWILGPKSRVVVAKFADNRILVDENDKCWINLKHLALKRWDIVSPNIVKNRILLGRLPFRCRCMISGYCH